jgi:hypothetical protein
VLAVRPAQVGPYNPGAVHAEAQRIGEISCERASSQLRDLRARRWASAHEIARASPGASRDDAVAEDRFSSALTVRDGNALPMTMAAAMDPARRVVASAFGGYDAALSTGIARFVGDVNLIGPLDARVGMTYHSDVGVGQNQFQPQLEHRTY